MEPLDFLTAVLPSTGVYCVAELSTKKKKHAYVETIAEAAEKVVEFEAAKYNTFFALASFATPGIRFSDNAVFMRTLVLDIDCGKGKAYPQKRTAAAAFTQFLKDTNLESLGQPWLIDSGGGLHIYWPLLEDATIAEWLPVAEGLKRLALRHDLHIDMTVTADAARILRVPGTTNRKPEYPAPRPTSVKHQGDFFHLADLKRIIGTVEVELHSPIPGVKPKGPPSATAVKLIENSAVFFKDIKGCKQIEHYEANAQQDGMEPLWRGVLSIARVCEDAEEQVVRLSALHPYPEDRMRTKLREIKGPYPCTKLDSENPGVCPECPHWGKITNPLALGRKTVTETEAKTVEIIKREEVVAIERPPAPRGYSYGKSGGVYREKAEDDGEGNRIVAQVLVVPFDLFVVDVMHVDGVHSIHMLANRPEGAKDVVVPTKALVSKDDTVKALAEQNILAAFGAGNDKNLFDYVRACYEDANLKSKATNIPTQYGWQADESFVLNGKIYFPDGSSRIAPMPGLENITAATKPAGTLDGWRAVIKLLIRKELFDVLAHGCIGFGAPLMCFTGMRGLTFHAGHKESGTGKSLALSIVASVWGHPVDYRTGKSTSPVAMQQRAGNLNSLPFVSDELTMRARGDAEWFPAFVFDFSEGRGKERMEARLNRERINTSTWSTLAMFTSNTRMLDYMTGVRQHSSEGELRRFLEWSPRRPLAFDPGEQRIVQSLSANYGVAGEVYAQWLVTNREVAQRITQEVKDNIFREFKATNDERFWIAGISAVVAGAILAGKRYAGIIDLPVGAITEVFQGLVENARTAIRESAMNGEDILNDYIREFYGQFVVIRGMDGKSKLLSALANGDTIDHSITRTKIMGRVEHDMSPGWVEFFIEEQMLKRHCAVFGYGYSDFKEEMEKRFKVQYVRKDMLAGTKGPPMRVSAYQISRPLQEVQNVVAAEKQPEQSGKAG